MDHKPERLLEEKLISKKWKRAVCLSTIGVVTQERKVIEGGRGGDWLKVKVIESENESYWRSLRSLRRLTQGEHYWKWKLLPPKLQRRGLVFKRKWLLWSVYDGLLWSVKNGYFGIWVIRASGNFIRVRDVFWRLLVTVENDDVSTKLIIIFIIELGIWVILACANFIRPFFDSCWLLQKMMIYQQNWL